MLHFCKCQRELADVINTCLTWSEVSNEGWMALNQRQCWADVRKIHGDLPPSYFGSDSEE